MVTVLDVRPGEGYEVGHTSGALNIPLNKIQRQLANSPKEQEITANCRVGYCLLAFAMSETLAHNNPDDD